MIIRNLIVLCLAVFTTFTYANAQQGAVLGHVADEQTGEAIPYASVALMDADGAFTGTGTLTDGDGNFRLSDLRPGTYSLSITFIGYSTGTSRSFSLEEKSGAMDLGSIPLAATSVDLEEVEVTANAATSAQKIDRRVYRASDFKTAAGGTAKDVISKLPSVQVDPDGMVSVRGTTDFIIYLDGRPTNADPSMLLGQISGDAISRIEVITVPTARYDAQGKGGIINIVTEGPQEEGFSFSGTLLGGGAPWGNFTTPYDGYAQNDNRYGGSMNLSYVKSNLSLQGGLYYNHRNVNGKRTGDARLLQADGSYFHMVAGGERPEWYDMFSANAGLDYRFSNGGKLGLSYYYGDRNEGRSAFYVYETFFGDRDKNPVTGVPVSERWVYNPNTDNRYGIFHVASANYAARIGGRSGIEITALYEHSGLSRELHNRDYSYDPGTDAFGSMLEHFRQTDDTPLNGFRLNIDFDTEFDNGHTFSAGLQPQYLSQSGSFSYDTLNLISNSWGGNAMFNNSIDLTRGIYAGYLNYAGSVENLQFVAGLRLEYTDQELTMSNPDYFTIFERVPESTYAVNQLDWFPSLHLNYDISDRNRLMFAASRRISRPPTKNMAPFLYRRHFEVYVVGDPALKPEYITNVELTYDQDIGDQKVGITGFYRGTNNAIFRVNTVYEVENVLIRSYTNSGNTTAMGGELNTNLDLGKRAKLFIGGSLYDFRIGADIFGFREDNRSLNWSLKSNLNVKISDALSVATDVDVRSATVTAQGGNELFYMANLAVEYAPEWLKGWKVSLKVLDYLASNNTGLYTRAYDSDGIQIFYQETLYERFGPIAEFTLSHTFNSENGSKRKVGSTFGKEQF